MSHIRTLFSLTGLLIIVYFVIGVFVNTAPPHWPGWGPDFFGDLHSWAQFGISSVLWPLKFWKPVFTTGKWVP